MAANKKEPVNPFQLGLFASTKSMGESVSNAIDIYDAMPKYVFGKKTRYSDGELSADRHIIERQFTCPMRDAQGERYYQDFYLRITPAVLIRKKSDGTVERFFSFPSHREMLVEDVIRKQSINDGAKIIDGKVGCLFTVYQIKKALKEAGHELKHSQIVEAINTLNKCSLEYGYVEADGKTRVAGSSPLFPEAAFRKVGNSDSDDGDSTYVTFHHLVTKGINNLSYRPYDYETALRLKSGVSLSLHRRLSLRFTYAGGDRTYDFKMNEFIQSIGLDDGQPHKAKTRIVREAIAELQEAGVILRADIEDIRDTKDRRRILDVNCRISVSATFISNMIKANTHLKTKQLESAAKVVGE